MFISNALFATFSELLDIASGNALASAAIISTTLTATSSTHIALFGSLENPVIFVTSSMFSPELNIRSKNKNMTSPNVTSGGTIDVTNVLANGDITSPSARMNAIPACSSFPSTHFTFLSIAYITTYVRMNGITISNSSVPVSSVSASANDAIFMLIFQLLRLRIFCVLARYWLFSCLVL